MPNSAGGMTIVQLGADMCNEGRADECRQVQTSANESAHSVQTSVDSVQTSVDSVQTGSKVVYTP